MPETTRNSRRRISLVLTLSALAVLLAWWGTAAVVVREARENRSSALLAVVESARRALDVWSREEAQHASWWAQDEEVVSAVEALLQVYPTQEWLLSAPA